MKITIDSNEDIGLFCKVVKLITDDSDDFELTADDLKVPDVTNTTVGEQSDLDSAGFPWDARINATTKKKTNAGIWKKLKGVDEATYNTVRTELRKTYPAPNTGIAGSAAPAATEFPPLPGLSPFTSQGAPAPIDPPHKVPAIPEVIPTITWPQVCKLANDKIESKKLTSEGLNALAVQLGCPQFALVATRQDLYDSIYTQLSIL